MRSWPSFFDRAFGRYALTSALATASDFALAGALHAGGCAAGFATLCGCVAGGAIAFRLSRSFAFAASADGALPQLSRFLLVWASSALLNSGGVVLALRWLGSFPIAWSAIRAAVYLGWNYPLSRWFVFATERRRSAAADA